MKYYLSATIFFLQLPFASIYAQKPVIDTSLYVHWPKIQFAYISNDGRYVSYAIDNQLVGGFTGVLQSTRSNWKMEMDGTEFSITTNSRKAVFQKSNDSLAILTLGTDSVEIIPRVKSYHLIGNDRDSWLTYFLMDTTKELFIRNLSTGGSVSIRDAADYFPDTDGNVLIVKKEIMKEGKLIQYLDWVDLRSGDQNIFWKGTGMTSGVAFDRANSQVVFRSENRLNGRTQKSLWYYKTGITKAIKLINDSLVNADPRLLSNQLGFTEDGSRLFVQYNMPKEVTKVNADAVQVDVWSYTDTKLQSEQLNDLKKDAYVWPNRAVIRIEDHQVLSLDRERESIWGVNDHFALIYHREGNASSGESNWNPACRYAVFLVSIRDGSRKLIKEHTLLNYILSPEGKYLIWYEPKERDFFSQEVSTGITKNITKTIPTDWTRYENDLPNAAEDVNAISGWLKGDTAVLLHDQNDIWQVDPSGEHPPRNLTNCYGRRHHIVFRLAMNEGRAVLPTDKKILLTAFNRSTKDNGFYSKLPFMKGDPDSLSMGPYLYEVPDNNPHVDGRVPVKAGNSDAYLVRRSSATESPNYFYTTDFKHFTPMTDMHPEKEVNWLTAELRSWKTLDGTIAQGVLYKPENFDPIKKYPIIFYYYERLSDELNEFKQPEFSEGLLDIPTYVSNGYLVFTPDIHYKIGYTGESAVNSIISAAKYLSREPWVDSSKMGLQGHSFGGYETNYLVTHSHLFTAACSASGLSDFISGYGALVGNGPSEELMFERSQFRMGATLWQRPDLYKKNSPIFQADQVTTPLLMMHTQNDGICPFSDAVGFFTALRRLGKKVWMLQYDNNSHALIGNAAVDFTIRMQQFFDHYLKGAPAPKWMVEGIPARLKGIETGLELEPKGVEPGPGLTHVAE